AALRNFPLAAKTGTARQVVHGRYAPGRYTASFAALFPADRPQLVVVVKIADPRRGGYFAAQTAAPVTRAMLEQALAARTVALDRARLAPESAPRADRRRRRRRGALRRPLAVPARQRRRAAARRRSRRRGPGSARGGARAPPARVPRRAARLGRRGAHVAAGGRQHRRRRHGHPVRRARGPSGAAPAAARPAPMNRLAAIVAALEQRRLLVAAPDLHAWPEITGVSADTRRLRPGMLYCAVRGAVEDGHRFVAAARAQGAAAALVEREQSVELPQILVRDGRRAAAVAAETWYDHPGAKLDLVGVTGTNGKSTSVTLARHVLGALAPMGAIGTLGAVDPQGRAVPSEAGNLTTPG